jgi:phosphoglycolate phosphatase
VRLCVFDLDHTLVNTPLDLAAMALDMRAVLERACGPLPARPARYRVGELLAWCRRERPALLDTLWALALDHERRAMDAASLEAGAREAVTGARAIGFRTVVWTNNAAAVTRSALDRFGLTTHLDLVVTRDEMKELKPDPDGWRVIARYFSSGGATAAPPDTPHRRDKNTVRRRSRRSNGIVTDAVVVGDSWVDGVAAARAGVPFVAYRARPADLARWNVTPVAFLDDLGALPAWLADNVGTAAAKPR